MFKCDVSDVITTPGWLNRRKSSWFVCLFGVVLGDGSAADVAGGGLGRSHTEAVSRNGPSNDFLQYSGLR
jgi:hypothetical protein